MRERQQILIEEYEAAVAELQASNEEQVSVNEELQSANEELETAKEEQQSVNEELHTVNMELNTKIEQLDRANDDLRNLFEATGVATIILDEELAIRSFTPAVAGLFHLRPADCGRPLADIAGALDTGDVLRDAQRVLTDGATVERPVQRRDGSAEYLLRLVPYRAENGAVNGVLAAFVDITALAQAAKEREEQRLMVAELNHRVRNMLAVVGALTRQTLEADRPVAELADALVGRIGALAEAYQLIAREAWGDTPLAELVHRQLAPHLSHESRGTVEGPPVLLRASHALAVGLVLHELATNAVKYGALSGQHGHVAVTWETRRSATAASLVIRWQEQGGPPVSEPLREGFGSQLVHGQVELALNGTYEEHFAPEGFSATISIPMEPS
jgi:two-component system CheB/CheR fusion protein